MEIQATPDGSGNVVPTFTPSHYERAISTRATASNNERRQRALQVQSPFLWGPGGGGGGGRVRGRQ